jgi:hypothetical protein
VLKQPTLCRSHKLKKGRQNEKAILSIVDQSVVRKIVFAIRFCSGTLRANERKSLDEAIYCGVDSPFRNKDNRT